MGSDPQNISVYIHTDTSRAWDRRRLLAERSPTAPSESLRVTRALQLIADGELSRAQAMLLSEGIQIHDSDCMDPLGDQLRSRQPRRTTSMPTTPPTSHEVIATQISLRGVYRDLRRRRGAGVTGGRNEYLRPSRSRTTTRAQIGLSRNTSASR